MIRSFFKYKLQNAVIRLGVGLEKYKGRIAQASLPEFGNRPDNLMIELPRRIIQPENMIIGDNVSIGPGSFLIAITHYPSATMQDHNHSLPIQTFDPRIHIGSRVTATAGLQIVAQSTIVIEDDVMFASNVHVNDGSHGHETANVPYKYQEIGSISPITIKRGCWIGQNVMIMPGVTIGEMSIIGANSIVTTDIPERCIAVGNTAKVIKKWNQTARRWT